MPIRTSNAVTRPADVVVVGRGIAGLCAALAAADHGLQVTVADTARPGAASRVAAGLLAPSLDGLAPSVRAIAIEARDAYPDFLAHLRMRADRPVALDRNGILELASSASDLAHLMARAGHSAQALGQHELAQLEPALAGHAGALLHPHDGAVDNVALMDALDLAVASNRRIHRCPAQIVSFDFLPARPVAVTAAGLRLDGASVLLATGAWASRIPGLPRALPVRPVRGEVLCLDTLPIRHVTYGAGGYLVPRGSSLLIGATSDESGFDSHPSDAGRASLLAIATRAVPSLASANIVEHRAGLRPMTPDAMPILGRDPDVPGLVYACGFSRNGILLAPWAAAQLARLLAGGDTGHALAPFRPERFESNN